MVWEQRTTGGGAPHLSERDASQSSRLSSRPSSDPGPPPCAALPPAAAAASSPSCPASWDPSLQWAMWRVCLLCARWGAQRSAARPEQGGWPWWGRQTSVQTFISLLHFATHHHSTLKLCWVRQLGVLQTAHLAAGESSPGRKTSVGSKGGTRNTRGPCSSGWRWDSTCRCSAVICTEKSGWVGGVGGKGVACVRACVRARPRDGRAGVRVFRCEFVNCCGIRCGTRLACAAPVVQSTPTHGGHGAAEGGAGNAGASPRCMHRQRPQRAAGRSGRWGVWCRR